MPYVNSQRSDEPAPLWVALALRRAADNAKAAIWKDLERSEMQGKTFAPSRRAAFHAVDWYEIPRDLIRMAKMVDRGFYREIFKHLKETKARCGIHFPNDIGEWLMSDGRQGWMPRDK